MLHSISIHACYCSVLLSWKMTPQVILPNLKMNPQQNGQPWPWSRPPSQVINNQPIETFGKFAWFVKLIIFLSTSPSDPPFQSIYSSQWTPVIYQLSWKNPKVLYLSPPLMHPAIRTCFCLLVGWEEKRRLIWLNGVKLLNLPQPQFLDKSILPSVIKLVFQMQASIYW